MTGPDVRPDEMPPDLEELLQDLRTAAATSSPPAPGAALAMLFREGAAPLPSPVRRRRRRAVRIAVAGAVAAAGFGSLGVAGALPASVQERVADLAEHVGIDLPDGRPEQPATTVPPATTTTTTTKSPGTTAEPGGRPVDADPRGRSEGRHADDEAPGSTVPDRPGVTPRSTIPPRRPATPRSTVPERPEPAANEPDGEESSRPAPAAEAGGHTGRDGAATQRRNPDDDPSVDTFDRPGLRPDPNGGLIP